MIYLISNVRQLTASRYSDIVGSGGMVTTRLWGPESHLQSKHGRKSNKIDSISAIIEPDHNANGWDFGDNVEHEEGMLFEEDLLEYHREKTKCDPLTAVCTILFCPIFILMLMTWGPIARQNENCFGHTYFAQMED